MKFAFFGSPVFARIVLETMERGGYVPAVLVCNPDRPVGRKQVVTPPPTKQYAIEKNLKTVVLQPENKAALRSMADSFSECDIAIVAAYSHIIPQEVLSFFSKGVIGVHPSLLPLFRGASPIASALLAGEAKTGVTLYAMDADVDHGPLLAQEELDISDNTWTYERLCETLAEMAGGLLVTLLPSFLAGVVTPIAQDHSAATFTHKFSTEDGLVDMQNDDPLEIARKIRALNPEPGVYTLIDGKRVKLLGVEYSEGAPVVTRIVVEGKKPQEVRWELKA